MLVTYIYVLYTYLGNCHLAPTEFRIKCWFSITKTIIKKKSYNKKKIKTQFTFEKHISTQKR